MMESCDVAIVGAGPAGATLARLIGCGRKVMLFDRRRLDRPFDGAGFRKCCGGLLAPDAQKAMARAALALPESVLGGPQLFAVRSVDLAARMERYYQRFYLNLDREAFDRWLASLAAGSAECRFGMEFLDYDGDERVARFRGADGLILAVRCNVLIAADGGASAVRRKFQRELRFDAAHNYYLAIQETLEPAGEMPFYGAFFEPAVTDFYGWTIPKRDTLLLGVALLPGVSALRRFDAFKQSLADYGFRFGKTLSRCGAVLARPRRCSDLWLGDGSCLAIGEAAGWISPSSAEGFSFAFESARIVSELLLEQPEPSVARYRVAAATLLRTLRGKVLKSPLIYNVGLRHAIMKSGLTAINPSSGRHRWSELS
ncbi:MAG: FAD-binding protein [Victivallaceae bacterium]|nr:FAD-binding protein [Victivallaceae bacterium]